MSYYANSTSEITSPKKSVQQSPFTTSVKIFVTPKKAQKKMCTYTETQVENFVAMAFSYDARCLTCLTDGPEYKLVFIDLFSNKKN